MTHRFTGQELDQETGLYAFPARYYDPQTSRWMGADPAMGSYLPLAPVSRVALQYNRQLPGLGGVFAVFNLAVYHYGANNPLRYVDPEGREVTIEFAMDNPDGEYPIAIVDGERYGIGYGLDYDIGDVVPDDAIFLVPEGSQLDIQRNGEGFRISGAAFHGPSLGESRRQIADSQELQRAIRRNRRHGVGQIVLGLGSWAGAGIVAFGYSAAEASTPVPISTVAGVAATKKIGGLLSFGTFMIAFGLGRVTGQHNEAIFHDLVFASMPQIMDIGNALDELTD